MRSLLVTRSFLGTLALAAALLLCPALALACPFCGSQGQTLLGEVNQANLILYGTLKNAQRDPGEFGKGTTEMQIELVVKDHPILKGRKTLTLPRYIPVDPKNETKHLVFIEVFKDEIEPYRGEAVPADSKLGEYIKGALAVRDKDVPTQLGYFINFLDSPESVIANDAFMEFGNSDYKDYRPLAEKTDPERVVKWLQDPNTPASRYGLYGSMLGHCGKTAEHAAVLRNLLDDPKKRFTSGIDGILAGYVMLDRKEGWKYLTELLSNEKNEFLLRYAGLRAVRFFWEYRPDVVEKKNILHALDILVGQGDIADFPMDDLRKWGQWQFTDRILELYGKESHDAPIVKRAIIRFALCVPPENKKAAEFVAKMRELDEEKVRDIEELLRLEQSTAPAPKKDDPPANGATPKTP
jgi:hypothetical protein